MKHKTAALIKSAVTVALAASSLLAPLTPAKSIRPSPAAPARPDPETLLISIYKDLQASQLNEAQAKADALVEAYPNFRVGHLIRGDLLMMHAQPVTAFGGGAGASAPADKLKDLRDEARARLTALTARPNPELAPRSVLQLRADQRNVLVVDARQSRLYVYENDNGQLKFVTDYYISQGKLGIHKLREGDQKTPVGVYYITGRVSGARLPDFYGASALRINYPNEWDRANDRSGSGIFLHGTPSDTYSRPPLASDGCVVLTNADLKKLEANVDIGKTPVVIAEKVEFISRSQWDSERSTAVRLMDAWRADVESTNQARVLKHYSAKFKSGQGEDLKTWYAKDMQPLLGTAGISARLSDVTLFRYPGRDDMIVSSFTLETMAGKTKTSTRKRQYWAREGANWKIVNESPI